VRQVSSAESVRGGHTLKHSASKPASDGKSTTLEISERLVATNAVSDSSPRLSGTEEGNYCDRQSPSTPLSSQLNPFLIPSLEIEPLAHPQHLLGLSPFLIYLFSILSIDLVEYSFILFSPNASLPRHFLISLHPPGFSCRGRGGFHIEDRA
jgi:hypothetical protein